MGNIDTIYCRATLNYHDGLDAVAVEVDILDGRNADLALEDSGFELLDHSSTVGNWRDHGEIDEAHGPELAALASSLTGCDVAIVYPALLRNPDAAASTPDHAPIELVHSDFTDDYGRMVTEPGRPYRTFLDPRLAHLGLSREDLVAADRLMMLQFWRNTGPRRADHPLAFCDARDIDPTRLLRFLVPEYGGLRLEFETFTARPPGTGAQDRWYTFPELSVDEVVAFRTYDSARVAEELPYWTPHSAFRDPHVSPSPDHRRESVEMRVLCVWR